MSINIGRREKRSGSSWKEEGVMESLWMGRKGNIFLIVLVGFCLCRASVSKKFIKASFVIFQYFRFVFSVFDFIQI